MRRYKRPFVLIGGSELEAMYFGLGFRMAILTLLGLVFGLAAVRRVDSFFGIPGAPGDHQFARAGFAPRGPANPARRQVTTSFFRSAGVSWVKQAAWSRTPRSTISNLGRGSDCTVG